MELLQDLLDVGAYQRGANPLVDAGVDHEAEINAFLTQRIGQGSTADESWSALSQLVARLEIA